MEHSSFQLLGLIALIALVCEFVDSTLGMGYGTALSPILLILGFSPLQVVPAVLVSELVTGLLAAFAHQREGNVDFRIPRTRNIAWVLGACSVAGAVAAPVLAVNLPRFYVKLYIGVMVAGMGVLILVLWSREFRFSWKRIVSLGLLASFNKGVSGGGYGPLITSGQLLCGVPGKSAVGVTSLAEGLTCLIGLVTYALVAPSLDLRLAPVIALGAVLSVPFSAKSVRWIPAKGLKIGIASATLLLGTLTVAKVLL